jgi:hypothetical protein
VFPTHRTEIEDRIHQEDYPSVPRFSSKVALDTDGELPPLPVSFSTIIAWASKDQAFTPFAPELGYGVTMEDLDPEHRLAKVSDMQVYPYRDIPGHPLHLGAYIDRDSLVDSGILEADPKYAELPRFTGEARAVLERLQFHVLFANGLRFTSLPRIGHGDVSFHHSFFPCDTGPLPVPPGYKHVLEPGLLIALPPDPKQLATIEARFLLR